MANASTTQASSASATSGTPIPLTYGYAWVTGKRANYYEMQATGNDNMDFTRVGMWLLGHGEWDGCLEQWINDLLVWAGTVTPTTFAPSSTPPSGFSGQQWSGALDGGPPLVFNFHSGCDSIIGSGLSTFASSGPDQGTDVLWPQFPPAINVLDYSRIAYYTIMRKQPIQNQTNTHQNDPSQWTDINPIGLWRALRCRLFDDEGNQTGYAFTTNPAWHFVDVLLRRKLMPDYNLTLNVGPDVLTAAVQNRFDWGSIYASAQYFDEILSNGRRRFQGSYAFATQTSLQAVLEQILLCCRSFMTEYAGKIALKCDMPRSSVFTFTRNHALPGSFSAGDQDIHLAGNRYISTMRDLLIPECNQIASITCVGNSNPEVTTTEPHPFNAGDRIAIGGTDTPYDGGWVVETVPDVVDPGTPEEVFPTTFTVQSRGANYPPSVGAGGGCGLLYSRFALRNPEFWHKANMLARGAVGLGIPRLRNKIKVPLDFSISTYDQVSRITRYERDYKLGVDTTGANGQLESPYITPKFVKLRTSMFAKDTSGNLAAAIQPGDRVTVDPTLDFQYQGDYEVIDPLVFHPPTVQAQAQGGSLVRAEDPGSGEIEFTLGPYDESIMYDTSDPEQAGWPSVPGSDPGNDSNFTAIALAGGGTFVFFTGFQPTGSQFQLPSTGFSPGNMLAWVGPAGTLIDYHSAHIIQICAADAYRNLTLIYSDCSGFSWGGDCNFACVAWLSAAAPTSSGGMTWLELTLDGGEEILFGQGLLADGTTIEMPAGWTSLPSDQVFAVAFPHDQPDTDNIMFIVGAYVDSGMVVHLNASDDSGHLWHGDAAVLVFAVKNNMGSFTFSTIDGANWATATLGDGTLFGAGCQKNVANGGTFALPPSAGDGSTLQAMVGSSDGTYEAGMNHAQGVGACYLDADNVVHITFNDGAGDTWAGQADVFAIFCASGSGIPTLVSVSPPSATLAQGATQQFTAAVTGNANQNVTWSVDGFAGGNVSVGTINAEGIYTAPDGSGTHTITATSVADPTAMATATVNVTGAPGAGTSLSVLTDDLGNPILSNGNVIYVVEG